MLISEIIQQYIIDNLDRTVKPIAVSAVADDLQTVTFCDLKWMKLYDGVFNGETGLIIDSYFGNEVTFQVLNEADKITLTSTVTIGKPLFLNGTLSNTKSEWDKFELGEREKLPFIWLVSPTTETTNSDDATTLDAPLKLWFVHWSDWNKLNADRQAEAVKPLFALVDEFTATIKRTGYIFNGFSNKVTRDFPKFGTETKEGTGKLMFNSTLSAIEMDINVNIFVNNCIKC